MQTERCDAAIVGAGIVGLAVARELARAGRRVLLVDRGPPGAEASAASAAMLAAQVEAHAGESLLEFGVRARDRHLALAAELEKAGRSVGLQTGGILVVTRDAARAAELQRQATSQRALGLEAAWLDSRALRRLRPGIAATALGAFHAPHDGCVDNVALCAALRDAAQAHGAMIITAEASGIECANGRVTALTTGVGRHATPVVIVAAGAWSASLAGLPRPIPVEPVRGQVLETVWPGGERAGIVYGDLGYVVPRRDRALLGSTSEHVGFDKGTTAEGIATIRAAVAAVLPAFATAPETRRWAGLRPMSKDGLPILGRDPDVEGLIYATGHGRNGILLAPITGEIVRDLVVRGETSHDISAYAVTRFQAD